VVLLAIQNIWQLLHRIISERSSLIYNNRQFHQHFASKFYSLAKKLRSQTAIRKSFENTFERKSCLQNVCEIGALRQIFKFFVIAFTQQLFLEKDNLS